MTDGGGSVVVWCSTCQLLNHRIPQQPQPLLGRKYIVRRQSVVHNNIINLLISIYMNVTSHTPLSCEALYDEAEVGNMVIRMVIYRLKKATSIMVKPHRQRPLAMLWYSIADSNHNHDSIPG